MEEAAIQFNAWVKEEEAAKPGVNRTGNLTANPSGTNMNIPNTPAHSKIVAMSGVGVLTPAVATPNRVKRTVKGGELREEAWYEPSDNEVTNP